ncbi:MAG: adenosylcobinamide-phosphate synthase CbiB [Lachnospiraceae bacterium]|nr:adenosylcobinamide-phosphate synthase CbiB [Lachnospiraceae bacterium]
MKVIIGYFMDLIFGDPEWIPHPVVFIGKAIDKWKKAIQKWMYGCSYEEAKEKYRLRNENQEFLGGCVLMSVIVGGTYLITKAVVKSAGKIHPKLGEALETFLIFQTLATKCLKEESMKVYDKLDRNDLSGARTQIGYLVGRDTEQLSEEEIIKATVETVAENTADGVVAPMFYAAIGGAPLAMAYKAVNTLDSMVGYKNEEYKNLGTASAKMDDLWNLIPARLSAFAMLGGSKLAGYDVKSGWKIFKRDRNHHLSPNSAQTESVAAGTLHIQLGGTHDYFGKPVKKPTIGDDIRPVEKEDIVKVNKLLYGASLCAIGAVTLGKGLSYLRKKWK